MSADADDLAANDWVVVPAVSVADSRVTTLRGQTWAQVQAAIKADPDGLQARRESWHGRMIVRWAPAAQTAVSYNTTGPIRSGPYRPEPSQFGDGDWIVEAVDVARRADVEGGAK